MIRKRMAHILVGIILLSFASLDDAWAQWPNRFEAREDGLPQFNGGRVVIEETVVDDQGYVYSTGYFEGTVDFGVGNLTSAGEKDGYLLKLSK